jgi:hypothetical protein
MKHHFPTPLSPTAMDEHYLSYQNDIASIHSKMDTAIESFHQDMVEIKDTINKQGIIIIDIQEKVSKQGSNILGMQVEFKSAMLDILTQIKTIATPCTTGLTTSGQQFSVATIPHNGILRIAPERPPASQSTTSNHTILYCSPSYPPSACHHTFNYLQ